MPKEKFFHTFEFNCSLIVAFFIAFVAVTCVILPAAGLHRLGVLAGDELSRYSTQPESPIRPAAPPPINPVHGEPVAIMEGAAR